MIRIKKILSVLLLTFILIYIPLSFTIYSETWYNFNIKENEVNGLNVEIAKSNLLNFLLFKEKLNPLIFSEKEIKHYKEVRNIYSVLFALFFIFSFTLSKIFRGEYIKSTLKFSASLLILSFAMFINFRFFWDNIFHNIFFRNDYYINTPNEISYYLFPLDFFLNSIIFILIFLVLEMVILYYIKKNLTKNSETNTLKKNN